MRNSTSRAGVVSSAWLFAGGSLAAMAAIVVLLWNPHFDAAPAHEELTLYCAAGLMPAANEVAEQYEHEYGVKIVLDAGPSNALLTRLKVLKQPHDLFLAADDSYIRTARDKFGLVAESIPVARLHPVIAVKADNPKSIAGVADLLRDDVKVALATEDAAVGKASKDALQKAGQWDALEQQSRQFAAKVSFVATEPAVALAVQQGQVDAGILWDATAKQRGLKIIEAPEFDNVSSFVTIGVLTGTQQPARALHFARYLTARDKGLPIFAKHDLQPVADGDRWTDRPVLSLMSGAMLRPAIEQVTDDFQKREGVEIRWIYNGCGILVSEMKAGARPEAYFSCDTTFMSQVQQYFLEPVELSENDMLILVKKGNPKHVLSLNDLTRADLRVGLADAEHSALGALTKSLLDRYDLYGKIKPEELSDTGHALVMQVAVGPLDATIVYRSNAMATPATLEKFADLVEIDVPHRPAVQPFAIGKDSEHKYLMRRLLAAIQSPQSQQRFEEIGFRWRGGAGSQAAAAPASSGKASSP